MISFLLDLFLPDRTRPNEFEKAVLEKIAAEVPAQIRAKLDSQIREINRVQRLDGGREIDFYRIEHGRVVSNTSSRLYDYEGERILANIEVFGNEESSNSGSALVVDGYFFSLNFKNPTEHTTLNAVTSINVRIFDITSE
jgi:hypothetical protein